MTKQEIIDHIRRFNRTAEFEFLAGFSDEDLLAYLHQLQEVEHEHRRRYGQELTRKAG